MDEQDPELNDKEDELVAMVDQLEDALMGVEMKLVDLLSTATADFKGKVDNQINDMKKETISYIKEISNQDVTTHRSYRRSLQKILRTTT